MIYTKEVRIEQGVNVARALHCLDHFIHNYVLSHNGPSHPVVYGGDRDRQTVTVYQTKKCFIVRKG